MKKVFVLLLMVLMVASIAFANGGGESKKIELAATTGGMSADSPAGKGMALFAQKVAEYFSRPSGLRRLLLFITGS